MLNAKSKVLIERVTRFYSSKHWQSDSCCREWLELIPLLSKLELEEASEAYEMLSVCVLMAQSDNHQTKADDSINPLNDCLVKLKKLIIVAFWAKIIEIELSTNSETEARMKTTELVATLPQYSRSAIKKSMIDAVQFPLASFAKACLTEPALNLFKN